MTTALWLWALPMLLTWRALRALPECHPIERLGVALAVWLGLSAVAHFLMRWAGVPHVVALFVELAVAALCGLGPWPRGGRGRSRADTSGDESPRGLVSRDAVSMAAVAVLALGALAAGVTLLGHLAAQPHGAWDAWAIWNLQAAFLAQDGEAWRGAFAADTLISHPDYPVLVASAVARGWALTGVDVTWVPAAIAVLFVVATTCVVVAGAWRVRGPAIASAVCVVLLMPDFLAEGASQQADVPLACFTALALVLATSAPATTMRLVLVGVLCGCAAWTKNEGLVVALALPTLLVLDVARIEGRARGADVAADLAIGLLPLLVPLALFKMFLAPEGDIAAGFALPGAWRHWLDTNRVWFVAREMTRGLLTWSGAAWSAAAWLVVAALWTTAPARHDTRAWLVAGVLAVQLGAFFVVYVMTPYSVAWHLSTSWTRLVVQLWPMVVWGAVLGRRGVAPAAVSHR